ncbi:MAG: hypothetical protein Q7U97_17525 [Rhodocyclaceae bacterium]|nr:hypothetical protein [Rhodocyclaceae bacterium]
MVGQRRQGGQHVLFSDRAQHLGGFLRLLKAGQFVDERGALALKKLDLVDERPRGVGVAGEAGEAGNLGGDGGDPLAQGLELRVLWRRTEPPRLGDQFAGEEGGRQVLAHRGHYRALDRVLADSAAFSDAVAPIPIGVPFRALWRGQEAR